MKRTGWGMLLYLAIAGGLLAQEEPEPAPQNDDEAFFLFGVGEYRHLGESLYLGALYVPLLDVRIRPESPKYMEMRITTETLSPRRFTRHWMEGLTLSSSRQQRLEYADAIRTFSGLFTVEFRRGDRIRFAYQPDRPRIVVTVNGVEAGAIEDSGFFAFLLDVWIGDTPVSTTLKNGILGTDEQAARQMKQTFRELQYTQDRRRRVAESLGTPPGETETSSAGPAAEVSAVTVPPLQGETARLAAELEAARQEAERLEAERREAERLEAERQEREAREAARARQLAEEKRRHEEQQQRLGDEYRGRLVTWIRQFAEYPPRAVERRQEGKVELSVTTDRQGQITESEILEASGSYLLDNAAEDMLEKSEPLPVMPENLEGDSFTFIMPISFAL